MPTLLVNGRPDVGLPGDDLGLLRGLSVFDTLRAYGRVYFRRDAHLERLAASAAAMDVPLPARAQLVAALEAHVEPDARARLTATASGNWVLDVGPLDATRVAAPTRVARLAWSPSSFLPGAVKHTNRAAWQLAARRHGVDEVLLVDPRGLILEASRSNVVAVVDGRLRTPPADGRALVGVTRAALLDAARAAGLPFDEAPVAAEGPWDELYLASTLKELSPVVAIGEAQGPGAGPVGGALLAAFRRLVAAETGQAPAPLPAWARAAGAG